MMRCEERFTEFQQDLAGYCNEDAQGEKPKMEPGEGSIIKRNRDHGEKYKSERLASDHDRLSSTSHQISDGIRFSKEPELYCELHRMKCSGAVLAHTTSTSQVQAILLPQPPEWLEMCTHDTWLIFFFFFGFLVEIGFCHVGKTGLKLLTSKILEREENSGEGQRHFLYLINITTDAVSIMQADSNHRPQEMQDIKMDYQVELEEGEPMSILGSQEGYFKKRHHFSFKVEDSADTKAQRPRRREAVLRVVTDGTRAWDLQ
ncbi:hypothetical protein AAY473_016527 [Plecturocebus cupreus]